MANFERATMTPKQTGKTQIKRFFVFMLMTVITSMLLAFPIKWLWNWLVPELFGLVEISALQAWGLAFMLRLIIPREININEILKK